MERLSKLLLSAKLNHTAAVLRGEKTVEIMKGPFCAGERVEWLCDASLVYYVAEGVKKAKMLRMPVSVGRRCAVMRSYHAVGVRGKKGTAGWYNRTKAATEDMKDVELVTSVRLKWLEEVSEREWLDAGVRFEGVEGRYGVVGLDGEWFDSAREAGCRMLEEVLGGVPDSVFVVRFALLEEGEV
jgi:hypothetical protein